MALNNLGRIGMGIAGAALIAGGAFAVTPTKTYVMKAGAGDLFEKKSSELELKSTQDPKIRDFANMMVTDHSKSTMMVKKAAMRSGLHPKPPMLDAKQQSDLAALMAAQGTDRDQLYVTQQKAAHQDALALHQDYADSGTRPALKMAAAKIVPVVQQHIDMLNKM